MRETKFKDKHGTVIKEGDTVKCFVPAGDTIYGDILQIGQVKWVDMFQELRLVTKEFTTGEAPLGSWFREEYMEIINK